MTAKGCLVVAEIGINHNGDVEMAKRLITVAAKVGCEAVKFQKRTVDIVYSADELARPRESVFGTTNGDLKRGLEFGAEEYDEIVAHCDEVGVMWAASCWDIPSVDFIEAYSPSFHKVASASLTDDALLERIRATDRPVFLSTGMSTLAEIDHAVEVLGTGNLGLLHCTSTYPTASGEINLRAIETLRRRYGVPVGFSGHEAGTAATLAAVALGACVIERHVTLDRKLWGSDQAASLEPDELARMVADIRTIEQAMGDGIKCVYDSEIPIRDKLRRVR
jgi:N-acetylneuraminate synthase